MQLVRLRHVLVLACVAGLGTGCAGSRASETRTPGDSTAGSAAGTDTRAGAPDAPVLRLGDAVAPVQYRVELVLDPEAESFEGAVTIELDIRQPVERIWLNATDIEVSKASLAVGDDDWAVDVVPGNQDVVGFALKRQVAPGKATLTIAYRGRLSDREVNGVFRQQDGDHWYVYTQFEPIAARRAFPCFDEPGFKVPWQLTIHAREGHMALTNTPEIEETESPHAGMRAHRFAPTKPVPSYLIAFAVGPFETVDLGGVGRNQVPARIVVPHGRTGEASYAAKVTGELLSRLEAYFDSPYPYAKLDSIAIPQFGGAMEHPGLITYSARLLLSRPEQETVGFRRAYASVGAHELAHQWFGNLVTLAWWNDLWLNESFATWMAAKIVHQWKPEWNSDVYWTMRGAQTMGADSLISARKIRQPIESRHDIHSAFDAISYGKGGAVLTMFERWIGADAFRDGVRAYLKKHAWGTATADDFLAAITTVGQPEAPGAFRSFLDQAGVPVISVDVVCEPGEAPAIELAQERFLPVGSAGSTTDRTWEIPVCVKYGGKQAKEQCVLMREETATLELDRGARCPDWVLANADAAGYYRVAYGSDMQAKLLDAGSNTLSTAERVRLLDDIEAMITAGKMEMGEVLVLVPGLLADKSEHVARTAAHLVRGVRDDFVPAALEANRVRFLRKTFGPRARKLGWRPRRNEREETQALRRTLMDIAARDAGEPALVKEAIGLVQTWLDKRTGIDPEMLELALATAGRHGDAALHERMEQAILSTGDRRERVAIIDALAEARDPARVRKNLALYTSGKLDIREAGALLFGPMFARESRDMVYEYVKQEYDALVAKLPRRGPTMLIYLTGAFCDQEHLEDARAFFGPKAEGTPGGPKALAQTLERVGLCIAQRRTQQPSIEAFFTQQ